MTGSGKTGLCLGLIEEALLDGIPVLIIDPKGDLPNLLLTFPDLRPEDFAPVGQRGRCAAEGRDTPDVTPSQQAELWRKGLATGDRTARGSGACARRPTSPSTRPAARRGSRSRSSSRSRRRPRSCATTRSCSASGSAPRPRASSGSSGSRPTRSEPGAHPPRDDPRGRVAGAGPRLAGAHPADPEPPDRQGGRPRPRGVLPGEGPLRAGHALTTLLAAPGFEAWLEGEPLDVAALLYTPEGKPRTRSSRSPTSRRRADVLRLALAERDAGLDARASRARRACAPRLHGRDLRLLPARRRTRRRSCRS